MDSLWENSPHEIDRNASYMANDKVCRSIATRWRFGLGLVTVVLHVVE